MCAFETIKPSSRAGRKSTSPLLRITKDAIYLNQYLYLTANKPHHCEVQVNPVTNQIRIVFKSKPTSSSRHITPQKQRKVSGTSNKQVKITGGIIHFRGILDVLHLKEPITIQVEQVEGQVTGTYQEKANLKLIKESSKPTVKTVPKKPAKKTA